MAIEPDLENGDVARVSTLLGRKGNLASPPSSPRHATLEGCGIDFICRWAQRETVAHL